MLALTFYVLHKRLVAFTALAEEASFEVIARRLSIMHSAVTAPQGA